MAVAQVIQTRLTALDQHIHSSLQFRVRHTVNLVCQNAEARAVVLARRWFRISLLYGLIEMLA